MRSARRSPESPASSLALPVDRTVKEHNDALRRAPVLGSIPSRLRPGLRWPFGLVLLVLLVLLSGPGSAAAQPCAEGDPAVDNRGAELAADCTTLLGLKDGLRGTAVLNWARDVAMDDWNGLTVAGTPARVTWLSLWGQGLTGTLPPTLEQPDRPGEAQTVRQPTQGLHPRPERPDPPDGTQPVLQPTQRLYP